MPKTAHDAMPAGLDRIVFFSDAVIAIAITILVLDIKAPEVTTAELADLGRRMLMMWPEYLGYFVSFWVIALYWVAHHRCFRYIRKYDRSLIYLNFLFLMFIAFMPFPTSLLFSVPRHAIPVALYAGTAAGMGFSLALVWLYAVRRRFIAATTPHPVVQNVQLYLWLPPLVFVLSGIVAAFNPTVAMYFWFLLIPVYIFRRHKEVTEIGDEI
jgi:uncharacterized membrane protein